MLHLLTPDGDKTLYMRGLDTPGGMKGIATARLTTPGGSITIFDTATDTGSLTVSLSAPYVYGAAASDASVQVATSSVAVSVAGGTPPYVYSWVRTTGDAAFAADTAPADHSIAAFYRPSVAPGASYDGTFTCTVTDARGATGTVIAAATVRNYGSP